MSGNDGVFGTLLANSESQRNRLRGSIGPIVHALWS